jgi:hypothetical protein
MGSPVVVLGASNVSRGLARLAAVVRGRAAGPVDLFVAAGHGRGYGVNTRVAMRRLPSILASGLWRALDRERVEAPWAIVTDVGNELLYGFSPDQIGEWVRDSGATIAITRLPLGSIAAVGPVRYRALRTFFVPGCRLTLSELKDAAARLDAEVQAVALEFGVRIIDQPAEWYGLDALHVRRRRLHDLWHAACDAWGCESLRSSADHSSYADWLTVGLQAAEIRSLASRMLYTPQPVMRRSGLRLWMY